MKAVKTAERQSTKGMEEHLMQYRVYRSLLVMNEARQQSPAGESVLLRLRMRDIERTVQALPMGRERAILQLHYLDGESVESCAELLGVSRATAYRLKRRGLAKLIERENSRAVHA